MRKLLTNFVASMVLAMAHVLCPPAAAADQFRLVATWPGIAAQKAVPAVSIIDRETTTVVGHTNLAIAPAQQKLAKLIEQALATADVDVDQPLSVVREPNAGVIYTIDLAAVDDSRVTTTTADDTLKIDWGINADWLEASTAQPTDSINRDADNNQLRWTPDSTNAEVTALIRQVIQADELASGELGARDWIAPAHSQVGTFDDDVKILANIKPNVGPIHAMMAAFNGAWKFPAAVWYANIKPNVGPVQYASLNLGDYGTTTVANPLIGMSGIGSVN